MCDFSRNIVLSYFYKEFVDKCIWIKSQGQFASVLSGWLAAVTSRWRHRLSRRESKWRRKKKKGYRNGMRIRVGKNWSSYVRRAENGKAVQVDLSCMTGTEKSHKMMGCSVRTGGWRGCWWGEKTQFPVGMWELLLKVVVGKTADSLLRGESYYHCSGCCSVSYLLEFEIISHVRVHF